LGSVSANESRRNNQKYPGYSRHRPAQSIDKVLGLHIAKVDDYIAKPFSPQELLISVDNVLAGKKDRLT